MFNNFFNSKKEKTADLAKERLRFIVAYEKENFGLLKDINDKNKDLIKEMQKEILLVIRKYFNVDNESIKISLDSQNNSCSVLEVNVSLIKN